MKIVILVLLICMPVFSLAESFSYPRMVVSYIDAEELRMSEAIESKDMGYFKSAGKDVENLLKNWGLGKGLATDIDKHPACSEAITDFLIVGLCKVMPPGTICEPATFFPKYENNLENCREEAAKG